MTGLVDNQCWIALLQKHTWPLVKLVFWSITQGNASLQLGSGFSCNSMFA